MTIPFFKTLYKAFSLGLCLSAPLQAISPAQELKACQSSLLAQLNRQERRPTQGCPVSEKLTFWLGISRSPDQFTPQELIGFLSANAHWPQHETLCRKAEDVIIKQASSHDLLKWFNAYSPQTPEGAFAYAKHLLAHNERTKAAKVAINAWHTMDLTKAQEKKFLSRFGHLFLEKDHIARLYTLLMDEDTESAKRLLPHLPLSIRKVAQTRMALFQDKADALQTFKALKADLQKNEGLLYELTKWHRKKDHIEEAASLLIKTSPSPSLGQKWWKERNYIARELIALKDFQKAYAVLKNHGLEPGSSEYAEAQWFLGWISLRFLKSPGPALRHFKAFSSNVRGAISKARGAYWTGRAYEAQKKLAEAEKAYREGAHYKTTYYGQLAAAKVHEAPYPALAIAAKATDAEKKKFEQNELVKAAHILSTLGNGADHEVRKFLLQIADQAQSRGERELAVDLAHHLTDDYVVWTAKKAGYAEPVLLKKIYPTVKISQKGQKIPEKAFVMSIIYQESRFMPREKSAAGAVGLMQLMPQTAAQEAKRLGIAHKESKLYDPQHNASLGTAHLSHLLDRFNQSYILTAAAYNAGKTPVERWLETFGDPREGNIDVVDWIELIPYGETRDYVQRVLENVTPYRSLDGKPKRTLVNELHK